jgi:Plasma-membrane choline transporter
VALIQAVREMVRSMRDNDGGIVACCADCLLGCIESLVEYFNKWAYIYVGLYGFSFMEAGSNVMTLFRNRGWSVIIADLMVDTVLFMVAIGVGALTALFTALIGYLFGSRDGAVIGVAAVFGFIVGYAISSTMFSVVSSAVNTVIVCYAEAPNEFQANHPQLSDRMRTAWRQAYPDEFRY